MTSLTNRVHTVSLDKPSLGNNTADADRLSNALKKKCNAENIFLPHHILKILPDRLRAWNFNLKCVLAEDRDRLVLSGIYPLNHIPIGAAIDLGTTRVVIRLLDIESGNHLCETAVNNPQIAIGPDVLTRIHHCERPGGLREMNRLVVDAINQEVTGLAASRGLDVDAISLYSLAGNTAMTHLFLGLNPQWIIREPYIPVVNRPGVISAEDIGLVGQSAAQAIIFPNIGSYFGGDLISGILYAGMHKAADVRIMVDVGTNAEVVLGNADWMIACAGAAGPALESGVAKMGMMAAPGVIDTVKIDPESRVFHLGTIENKKPIGICGSGVIDLAAQLFKAGMLDIRGKLVPDKLGNRYELRNGLPTLIVLHAEDNGGIELSLSQADIDSLIRSKAAMYTILEVIVTQTSGLAFEDLTAFYVAGTFGSFINPESAIAIGMLPDLPRALFQVLGNSSLGGAALLLCDPSAFDRVMAIRETITYIELNVNQGFMNLFSGAKFYPHTDRSRFPSVPLP